MFFGIHLQKANRVLLFSNESFHKTMKHQSLLILHR